MHNDAIIAAYELELLGYRRRGLTERAALVEQELHRLGISLGDMPREDVHIEPASTTQTPLDAPQEPLVALAKPSAPKRPTTRKKR